MSTEKAANSRKNPWVDGSLLGVGVLLALGIFAMVNYLSMRHYERFDWTRSKIYTLSEKSLQVVQQIDEPVEMVLVQGLIGEDEVLEATEELLVRYAAANPAFIDQRVVDLVRNPLEAQRLAEEYEISDDSAIILVTEEDRRFVNRSDLAEYDYSGMQFGQPPTMQSFTGEESITRALLELMEDHQPKVVFTRGHGEAPLDVGGMRSLSAARNYFDKENFLVDTWTSLGATEVPDGTDLLVIAGPTVGFLPEELEVFSRYLDEGGRMLVMLDPALTESGLPLDLGLEDWLARFGVGISDDFILDPESDAAFVGPEIIATSEYGVHPIVEPLANDGAPVMFSLARSVRRLDGVEGRPEGMQITELVRTSDAAWGETDFENLDAYGFDEADVAGPVAMGVAVTLSQSAKSAMHSAEVTDSEVPGTVDAGTVDAADSEGAVENAPDALEASSEGRLVVFGDLDFASDVSVANAGNSSLLLNTFNWLVQREYLISIEREPPDQIRLALGSGELLQIVLLVLVLQPGLALLAGFLVWRMRRR